ncbi:sensor histidine kinase RegB [Shimia ponticola]|uniref:sensor histidine kinase RegB n=1 Tax=Shimia ponticola TaxID=2582893 RepID=UPI0011BE6824|nr:ActS/PrrB/RegB family redox-sensitive histidine kinase [Shimia ponticola]
MSDTEGFRPRTSAIRLRTLVLLRWVAIAGQLMAITIAQRLYDLQLELGLCYLAVGVSVLGNLVAVWAYPENKRLTETETLLMLIFDVLQLCFLLSLTGGLSNPFALLVLAPVTISATVLPIGMTAILGAIAVVLITLTAMFNLPMRTMNGFVLRLPELFMFGYWLAILIGGFFIAVYTRRVTDEIHSMSEALQATQMALAREQKLTDLGGVVAAAAHELGTPLATIKLVSRELMEELPKDGDLHDDAELIAEQADRCRDILRSMGRAGKDDVHLRHAPLETVVREAAEPHMARGKVIRIDVAPLEGTEVTQPEIRRQPEIIHGVRNLVQNAVDFSRTEVRIRVGWSAERIELHISDDGRGYSAGVIGRLGDPFMGRRKRESKQRPGYEGMGLGLFIAKTLLERTGAALTFANGAGRDELPGAHVRVTWDATLIQRDASQETKALGPNQPIEI